MDKHTSIEYTASRYAFPITRQNTSVCHFLDTTTVELLQQYSSVLVTSVCIASTPIVVRNIPTPAQHVYRLFTLDHHTTLVMEKHERTELSRYTPRPHEEMVQIDLSLIDPAFRQQTLSEWIYNGILFYRTIRGGEKRPCGDTLALFWSMYHITSNHCQQWVWSMLLANQFPYEYMNRQPYLAYNQRAEEIKQKMNQHTDQVIQKNNYHPFFRIMTNEITDAFMNYVSQVTTVLARQDTKISERDNSYALSINGSTITFYDKHVLPYDACKQEEELYVTSL